MNAIRRYGGTPTTVRPASGRRVQGSSYPWSDPVSATEYLAGLSGYEVSGVIEDPGTRRITAITDAMGAPNRRFPAVHITGTNGKGSTSAMTTKLLRSQGLRVGTYTSPHLSDVTERIALDENPVSAEHFAGALGRVAWMSRRIGVTPTWFEAVTAAAFAVFADARVDAAVVEVGMLGRWDATNILDSTVAVVTNVDLDHTEFAGPSRTHIAMEKAGIVRPGTTLVLGETDPEVLPVFLTQKPGRLLQLGVDISVAHRLRSPAGSTVDLTTPWGVHRAVPINLLGAHQTRNAALALAAAEAFLESPIDTAAVHHALGAVHLIGRAEVVRSAQLVIIVDGAHNGAAGRALRDTLDEYFPTPRRRVLVCAASGSRDPSEFLGGIRAQDFDLVIATQVYSTTSVSAESVAAAARRSGALAMANPDVGTALRNAVTAAGADGLVVVAGSLYLVAPARDAVAALTRPKTDVTEHGS
jgi:dihydrofolate synthase / folylpolyglutamate synthase